MYVIEFRNWIVKSGLAAHVSKMREKYGVNDLNSKSRRIDQYIKEVYLPLYNQFLLEIDE